MLWIRRAWIGAAIVGALGMPAPVHAQRPALRAYTATDGLAHDRVLSVLADTKGFLWLGTGHGLSRFDGSRFINYGVADGLPASSINTIIEIGDDGYLVGTNGGGVGWYRPHLPATGATRFPMFAVSHAVGAANRVNILLRDRRGRVWVGTDGGLFELLREGTTLSFTPVPLGSDDDARVQVWSLADDARGRLWIGTSVGLSRRTADGSMAHDAIHPAQGADHVRALAADPRRGVWVGHDAGLFLVGDAASFPPFDQEATPGMLGDRLRFTQRDGLPSERVYALHRSDDGTVWVGTGSGLATVRGTRLARIGASTLRVRTLAEDRRGDIWIGTFAEGIVRLAAHGLTTYTPDDGLSHRNIQAVFETRDGRLAVVTDERALSLFDGTRFSTVHPNLPDHVTEIGRGQHIVFLEDSRGDWWVPSGDGLFRFTGVRGPEDLAGQAPTAFYTTRDGLAGGDIWRLFEDSRGDIWISTRVPGREVLTRWDRASQRFQRYGERDGLPPYNAVRAFAEDRAGHLWVGFWDGGAARLRSGRFDLLPAVHDPILAWHLSQTGTLWGASLGSGLIRIDNPAAAHPRIETLGTSDGLPSDRVVALTEDHQGRLYAGSLLGVTRFDPSTGSLRQYTPEDGLARSEVSSAFRDRTGVLWFGTSAGLSRLVPEDGETEEAPRLLIGGARVNGTALPIPDLGTLSAGPFEFGADQRNLEIEYLSLGSNHASNVQYRLEGAEQDWTRASDRRTVTYALLSSGSYRFVVRAPDGGGWSDASLTFVIRRPVWQRGWFVLSMAGLVALGLLAAHRTRVARLVAVERVRTRIAGDLHDDIGSNLSQIAILGEVLGRKADAGAPAAALARIADLARESVDSLSDIVWSIDPDKDRLNNLAMRMRRLASELLSAHDLTFTFAVHGGPELPIAAEVRRDVYLAFKETLHNVVRHASCRRVAIEVRLEGGRLGFTVRDDGRGFDGAQAGGHGLSSIRRRAERLGGTLSVRSEAGAGTTVEVSVPVQSRGAGSP